MSDAQPPAPPAVSSPGSGFVRKVLDQGWKAVAAIGALLALAAGAITNWKTIETTLFPAKLAYAASIVSHVESDISLQEYELQTQAPVQRTQLATSVTPGGSLGQRSGYRLAAYVLPTNGQPAAGTRVSVASEETKSSESKTASSAERAPEIKQEGEKITEEAKHTEEVAAAEKAKATTEQKSAEVREREEQKKAQEAHKRAQETQAHGAVLAKAEEAQARQKARKAKATVLAKARQAVRPAAERRVEAGTPPGRVEEVLREAHLPEHCRPTCGLKPIIEKALKLSADSGAAAAQAARAASRSPGVRVHYELTLRGLEHKVVVLSYALVQTNGSTPSTLYARPITIRTVAPALEREVVRGICWVPVPSSSRQYYLDLTVLDGETEVESKDTSDFS